MLAGLYVYDANFIASAVFTLSLLGIAAYLLYSKSCGIGSRDEVAMQQFLESTIRSSNSKFSFEGRNASVVRKDEDRTNGESTTYALIVYATNQHGEYFVFKSDGKTFSVRHLEHRLAQVILKHEYISTQPAG